VLLILIPLSIYLIEFDNDNNNIISIDGNFKDWSNIVIYKDKRHDFKNQPNINILEYSIIKENNRILGYLKVERDIFKGTNDNYQDSIRVFLDTDCNSTTGYIINSIGADYMLEASGFHGIAKDHLVFKFNDENRLNWRGWQAFKGVSISYNRGMLEFGFSIPYTDFESTERVMAYFQVSDNLGNEDFSDYLIDNLGQGALQIVQQPLVGELFEPLDKNKELMEYQITAKGHDIQLNSIDLFNDIISEFPNIQIPELPEVLQAENTIKVKIALSPTDLSNKEAGDLLQIDLASKLTNSALETGEPNIPVTVSGKPVCCYLLEAPTQIEIDGVFTDWSSVQSNLDLPTEPSTMGNPDIDIRDFRDIWENNKLSFYLKVDGSMMSGAQVLAKPKLITNKASEPSSPDNTEDNKIKAKPKPESIDGLDAAYIFIDTKPTEGNQLEDFQQNGIDIKANYLIELKGRNGNIFSKKFYRSSRAPTTNGLLENWKIIHDVEILAATDTSRMEAQIDLVELTKLLGINQNELQNIRIYYQMTDWSDGKDIGIKLPVFNGESSDLNDEQVEYKDSGTRAPPGDWPSQWVTLDTNEGNDVGGPLSNSFDIFDLFANDSKYILYLKMELQGLVDPAAQYTTYDFYFNVSATKWYRLRIYRYNSTSWNLTLNYTTSASVPDDDNNWIMEEEYNELTNVTEYDGLGCGFKYAAIAFEIAFWINKTNLSQGFGSLYKPNNCTIFADTHQQNFTQLGQRDRAPDSGIAQYASQELIPEFEIVMLPISIMLIIMALVNTKRKNRKRGKGILCTGGDCK
jgi:hypothetical protein